jgi:hypothetical protein
LFDYKTDLERVRSVGRSLSADVRRCEDRTANRITEGGDLFHRSRREAAPGRSGQYRQGLHPFSVDYDTA